MKQCARCGKELADNEQFCNRCGGTNFREATQQRTQQQRQQQRPQQQRPMQQRPQHQQVNSHQKPVQQRNQQQKPTQQRPIQQKPIQQATNNQQPQQQNLVQNQSESEQFIDYANQPKTNKKLSKKEKKAREMELMYAMKAAKERGEEFNVELYKQQHGWLDESCENSEDIGTKDWLITFIIMLVPIINLIMAFKGMNNTNNPSYKRGYYKAFMIYYIASFVISVAITFIMNYI